jgi:hypothetical protein
MTTWRDLTEQLTEIQIQQLTGGELHATDTELLDIARDYAGHNLLQSVHADVPVPNGMTATCWHDCDGAHRTLYGGQWTVGNAIVVIVGTQDTTGAITWQIEVQHVEHTVGDLTAEQCRELSAVLAVAADRLDQLNRIAQ